MFFRIVRDDVRSATRRQQEPLCTGLWRARIFIFRLSGRRWEEPHVGRALSSAHLASPGINYVTIIGPFARKRENGSADLENIRCPGAKTLKNNGADVAELVDAKGLKILCAL